MTKYFVLINFWLWTPCLLAAESIFPHFNLPVLGQHKTFSLNSSQKKLLYIDFWATWCEPCKESLPFYSQLAEKYKNEMDFILISLDSTAQVAEKFVKQNHISLTVLLDQDKRLADQLKLEAVPSSFLIDPEGKILFSHRGFNDSSKTAIEKNIQNQIKLRVKSTKDSSAK